MTDLLLALGALLAGMLSAGLGWASISVVHHWLSLRTGAHRYHLTPTPGLRNCQTNLLGQRLLP